MEAEIRSPQPAVDVVIGSPVKRVSGVIGSSGGSYPKYEGDYEVTPSMSEDITLETANKLMQDDVTVLKVPRYDVANEAGGTTVIIGGM